MFQGVEHLAIAAKNPELLARFYIETLQFRKVLEQDGSFLLAGASGSMLEVIPAHTEPGQPAMRDSGLRHIAISVDDFEAALQQLREHRVSLEGEPFWNGANRIVFFRDPENNILHLLHRAQPL